MWKNIPFENDSTTNKTMLCTDCRLFIKTNVPVEVTALTGVAARLINGRTLHGAFFLAVEKGKPTIYRQLSGQRLEDARRKWRYIKWLIIDEISMVSYEILRAVHLRLQEFKNNNELFGGVNILLFGDIMQLPPVKGNWCFKQSACFQGEPHLWHYFGLCKLKTNMRQQNDAEFVDLLNNLRVGQLNIVQYEMLLNRTYRVSHFNLWTRISSKLQYLQKNGLDKS